MHVVYSQIGGGQPVVLLHGFLEERGMWNDYAAKLGSEFNVITIDLLGQGESGNVGYAHSMHEHAAAVAAVLATEGVEHCTIIGHSMGGYVALAVAENFPNLVAALLLFHSTAYPDPEEKKLDRQRVIALIQRNKAVYVSAAIPSLFAEHSRLALKAEINELVTIASGFSDQGIIANVRGMMERKDQTETLRNGTFRKRIIHGELDPVISTDDLRSIAALANDISLITVPNIGHMGHLEASDECFDHIYHFCKN